GFAPSCGSDPVPFSAPWESVKRGPTVGVRSHLTQQRRRDGTLPTQTATTLLFPLSFSSTGLSTLTTLTSVRLGASVGEEEPAGVVASDDSLYSNSSSAETDLSLRRTKSWSTASSHPAESDDSAEAKMWVPRQRGVKQSKGKVSEY